MGKSWGAIIGFTIVAIVFFHLLYDYGTRVKQWDWVCILFAVIGILCSVGALTALISKLTSPNNDSN